MPHKAPVTEPRPLPDLECACATVRRVARLVTQLYSQEMGEHVEPAQFALLSVLHHLPGARQAALGRALGFDKTTLSRNLAVLKRNGWIEPVASDDLRERGYRLTEIGKQLLAQTRPGWQRAQKKLRDAIQPAEWDDMMKTFGRVAQAALTAGNQERNQ